MVSPQEDLLIQGLDDMLYLVWVSELVARHEGLEYNDWQGAFEPTLEAIRKLLEGGLAIAGDVVKGEDGLLEVQTWGLSPEATVDRIGAAWREAEGDLNPGDVVWLELTDEGRAEAEALSGDSR